MTTHAQAREYATDALTKRFGAPPAVGEVKALAGVACLETHYGDGWKGAGFGSNNMGAEQCGNWKGDRFIYIDTHPTSLGTSTTYRACFRKYASPADGWRALVDIVFVNRGRGKVRAAAIREDWRGVSQGLYTSGYYEGFGKTSAERIANHLRALSNAIAAADGDTEKLRLDVIPDVILRRGSRGEAVKLMQRELKLAADGLFGPITETTLKLYQQAHQLTMDGVCGPRTWAALLTDDYVPTAA